MSEESRGEEFEQAVLRALPRDLSSERVQHWLHRPQDLADGLRRALISEMVPSAWQRLFDACRQDEIDADFNESRFPLEPIAPDEDDWEVHQYSFANLALGLHGDEIVRRLNNEGYRRCGPRRGMQFISKNPDIQTRCSLVLPTEWRRSEQSVVPVFGRNGYWDCHNPLRVVRLHPIEGLFHSGLIAWLVLHKKK